MREEKGQKRKKRYLIHYKGNQIYYILIEKNHKSYVNFRPNPKYNNLSSSEDEEDDDSTQLKKLRRSPRKNMKSLPDLPPLPELPQPVTPQPSPSSSSSLPKQNEPERRMHPSRLISSPSSATMTAASPQATPEVSTKPRVSG